MKTVLRFATLLVLVLAVNTVSAQVNVVQKIRGSNGQPQCLAAKDGRFANGNPLIIWNCIAGDPSQTFYNSAGQMHIGLSPSNWCVAAFDGMKPGSRVGVYQCIAKDPNQSFGGGIYSDISALNGLCLGVRNASNNPGADMILWNCDNSGTSNQAWNFPAASRTTVAQGATSTPPLTLAVPGRSVPPPSLSTALDPSFVGHNGSALLGTSANTFSTSLTLAQIVAQGGGNLTLAQIVAQGGGNLDSRIVAQGGGNLTLAYIVAQGGGNLTTSQIVAQGGGNLSVLATIVAQGGGNALANAALARSNTGNNGASLAANASSLTNGGSLVGPSGGTVTSNSGNKLVNTNGSSYHVQSVGGSAQPPTAPAYVTSGARVGTVSGGVNGSNIPPAPAPYSPPPPSAPAPPSAQGGSAYMNYAPSAPAAPAGQPWFHYQSKLRGVSGSAACVASYGAPAPNAPLIADNCYANTPAQMLQFTPTAQLRLAGYCVTAKSGVTNGSMLVLQACQPGNPAQAFHAGPNGDLVANSASLCIAAPVPTGYNSANTGQPLALQPCTARGNDAQSWTTTAP